MKWKEKIKETGNMDIYIDKQDNNITMQNSPMKIRNQNGIKQTNK